jgi:hypothetical protein
MPSVVCRRPAVVKAHPSTPIKKVRRKAPTSLQLRARVFFNSFLVPFLEAPQCRTGLGFAGSQGQVKYRTFGRSNIALAL